MSEFSGLCLQELASDGCVEEELADFCQRDKCVLFSTGYMANGGVINALAGKGDLVIEDKLNHASLLDGGLSSGARFQRYHHSNLNSAKKRLAMEGKNKLVVTDGVFSMDGDVAPVDAIVKRAMAHQAWFMLDDAHGMGVLGQSGFGTVEAHGLSQKQVPIVMGTFGKAIGTAGAFIAGSQTLIDYLVNYARHYVYSTAMPPAQAIATLYSLTHIANDSERRDVLNHNVAFFRRAFETRFGSSSPLTLLPSNSAIQPIIVGSPDAALALSDALKQRGMWIPAIRYPTVPKGQDRLRITLSSTHRPQDIDVLIDALSLACEAVL